MDPISLDLELTRPDAYSGEGVPLRAQVVVTLGGELPPEQLVHAVTEALEAAIGFGQSRYGILRDEMPSRRAAVEEAARAALETVLSREGATLRSFAVAALDRA